MSKEKTYTTPPMDKAGFAYLASLTPLPLGHASPALAGFIAGWEACEKEISARRLDQEVLPLPTTPAAKATQASLEGT